METTSDDKLWAALCYIPFIFPIVSIIALVMEDKKNRPYIKFNAVQSLVLGAIGWLTSWLCVGVLVLIYMLYLAYLAYQGQEVTVPVVTDFIKKQGWA